MARLVAQSPISPAPWCQCRNQQVANLGTASSSSGVNRMAAAVTCSLISSPACILLRFQAPVSGYSKQRTLPLKSGASQPSIASPECESSHRNDCGRSPNSVITTDRADFTTRHQRAHDRPICPSTGRRWSTFALSTPGAVPDGGFGLVSFRGISGLLNNNTVDGADNNQAFSARRRGRTRISYHQRSGHQEFQINTSNYSAEYGRCRGRRGQRP